MRDTNGHDEMCGHDGYMQSLDCGNGAMSICVKTSVLTLAVQFIDAFYTSK